MNLISLRPRGYTQLPTVQAGYLYQHQAWDDWEMGTAISCESADWSCPYSGVLHLKNSVALNFHMLSNWAQLMSPAIG